MGAWNHGAEPTAPDWLQAEVSKTRQTGCPRRGIIPWQLRMLFFIWRFVIMQCPECGSTRIHLSRRRGILERGILARLFVRPFRCERCDFRFFRLSFTSHAGPNRTATTN